MRICLVTPAPAGSRKGNRVTALRWARLLRQLGHRVTLTDEYEDQWADVLVALHARRSASSVERWRRRHPDRPVIVALTGTDLYQDLNTSAEARRSLAWASRLVLLQPRGLEALPSEFRSKSRAIVQSARAPDGVGTKETNDFEVCVIGHLRAVKDPFRTALAARMLPSTSRIRVLQLGDAIEPGYAERARREEQENPRYTWLGERSRQETLRVLARCRLLVVSSELEGGANVVSEAIACGVPVLSTRIDGSVGLLGEEYPGYFPVGDTDALAALLVRCENDRVFYESLRSWCERLRPLVDPARERREWQRLLLELFPTPAGRYTLVDAGAGKGLREQFARDVAEGLRSVPRRLGCQYLYDEEGSLLFEEICELPEYYLTRAEREILRRHRAAIVARTAPGTILVEFGSGNASKTKRLIEEMLARDGRVHYVPVDISATVLDESARALLADLPGLFVTAVAGEYGAGVELLEGMTKPKLVLWLGSNIGNLDRREAKEFLSRVGEQLGPSDGLLVGIDLRKDRSVLERAYDDARGVTARFNKNLLLRMNRELGADFDPQKFDHRVRYHEQEGRVEMSLVSRCRQQVCIRSIGLEVTLEKDEAIHTEDSYKYSLAEIDELVGAAGLVLRDRWLDSGQRFSVNWLGRA